MATMLEREIKKFTDEYGGEVVEKGSTTATAFLQTKPWVEPRCGKKDHNNLADFIKANGEETANGNIVLKNHAIVYGRQTGGWRGHRSTGREYAIIKY